jgi:hypothetical protein
MPGGFVFDGYIKLLVPDRLLVHHYVNGFVVLDLDLPKQTLALIERFEDFRLALDQRRQDN